MVDLQYIVDTILQFIILFLSNIKFPGFLLFLLILFILIVLIIHILQFAIFEMNPVDILVIVLWNIFMIRDVLRLDSRHEIKLFLWQNVFDLIDILLLLILRDLLQLFLTDLKKLLFIEYLAFFGGLFIIVIKTKDLEVFLVSSRLIEVLVEETIRRLKTMTNLRLSFLYFG